MTTSPAARTARSLSATLRAALARKGVRLEQLASASGVPKATIHRWLSGATASPYFRDRLLSLAATLALTRAETNALLRAADMPTLGQGTPAQTLEETTLCARWAASARNNLPAELTSLVGRDDDITDLAMLLSSGPARLLTLTGPGGSGKTRLAVRVARELLDAFPGGVWFAPLATTRTPETALTALMRTLELPAAGQTRPLERLAAYLGTRQVLLVLDNLEQVTALGTELTTLLRQAPSLRVLTTSRVALRVYGEHLWPVRPLGLPSAEETTTAAVAPALRLYAERARAAEPTFELAAHSAAVAQLCARLDGLPLALELAAARSTRFTPAQLLESFPSRLDVSADGPLDVDERQRTLRAAIGWSVDLLDAAAQQLFGQLAVFAGGWISDAADAIYAAPAGPGLHALVEASLLTVEPRGTAPRYQLLETISEYAAERLTAADAAHEDDARTRHAEWYLELAATIPPYAGLRTGQANARYAAEHDNFEVALSWLLTHDPPGALHMAVALWPYWHEGGYFNDGVRWLQAALAPNAGTAPLPRARALAGLTLLTFSLGDYPTATRLADATLALAEAAGAIHELALVETYLGLMAHLRGGFTDAARWYERGLRHWRALNEPLGEARCHGELALVAAVSGDFQRAADAFDAADELYRRTDNADGQARALVDRGLAALMQFDIPAALALLSAAAQRPPIGAFDANLATAFCYLGIAQLFADDLAGAGANLSAALRLFNDAGVKYLVSYCLFGLAGVASATGQPARAARLCGASAAVQDALGVGLAPLVQQLYDLGEATIRAQLNEAAFTEAYAHGRELSFNAAVALALEDGYV